MKREIRYLVVKYKDMLNYLPEHHQRELIELIKRVEYGRGKDGRHRSIECVVVEHDWPEYEDVWGMIEARVDGTPTKTAATIAEKDKEIARLKARWEYIKTDIEGARALLILLRDGKGTPDDFDTMVDRIIESRKGAGL